MTRRAPRCPICGKPTETTHAPFCSTRCKDVDLHRWLTGAYAIRGRVDEEPARDAIEPDERSDERN